MNNLDPAVTLHRLFKPVRRKYNITTNKKRVRLLFCDRFYISERTFYRKFNHNDFTDSEIAYLNYLLTLKGEQL